MAKSPFTTINTDVEKAFWKYIFDRQNANLQKAAGAPHDEWWPTDAAEYACLRLSNVYREDNPGAHAIRASLRHAESPAAGLAGAAVYRYFNSFKTWKRLEHYAQIPLGPERQWADATIEVVIREMDYCHESRFGPPPCGSRPRLDGADQDDLPGMETAAVQSIIRSCLLGADKFQQATVEALYEWAKSMTGFGPGPAWELVQDLSCFDPLTPLGAWAVKSSLNEWAPVSGMARKSLEAMGVRGPQVSMLRAVREMTFRQELAFTALGLRFRWKLDGAGDRRTLGLSDMERNLAEFAKIIGTKKGRTKYP